MLGDAFTAFFALAVMIVATWLVIFGAGGAFLSRSYGQSSMLGATLGSLLGPVGWMIIWMTNR